jgi:ABC-type transporter Mla subunit MlaD
MIIQRSDLFVGAFLIGTTALVLAALIATSGWGVDRYDIFVRTNDATNIAVDTKIFLQGLEVGRVAAINPRPAGSGSGRLEFVLRLSLLDRFPDGTPLRLPRGTDAEVAAGLLGGTTVLLSVHVDSGGTLAPGDTIDMHRSSAPLEAFGALANDLKGTIEAAIVAATGTLVSTRYLADSLTAATGTTRRFIAGIQPGAEKVLLGLAGNLDRLRVAIDSTNQRTGITFRELNATIAESRQLMEAADSLTRLLVLMGGENRPEIRGIIANLRQLSVQIGYVLEQLGRRPMRLITGVRIPDSLSVERRMPSDTARAASRDTTPSRPEARP